MIFTESIELPNFVNNINNCFSKLQYDTEYITNNNIH
jgi:hypothetical protein